MEKNEKKPAPDLIEKLIRAEEEDALRKFRASDFQARLEKRIQKKEGEKHRLSFFRQNPKLIWGAAGLLLAAGVIVFLAIPRHAPSEVTVKTLENVLSQMPGFQAIERQPSVNLNSQTIPPAPLEAFFAFVLSQLEKEKASIEFAETASPNPYEGRKAPPLDLQKKYEILIIEKSIERVLSLISQRFKEA
jgi:hypothetical protein